MRVRMSAVRASSSSSSSLLLSVQLAVCVCVLVVSAVSVHGRARHVQHEQRVMKRVSEWQCEPLTPRPTPPTSVRDLSPADISVVMALGDSITAGFAMHSEWLVDGLVEYRGDVYCVGGNKDAVTLPNLLKQVRGGKAVVGASEGVSLPLDAIKFKDHIVQPFDAHVAHLNAAQSMAKVGDVLNGQVAYLVDQLRTTYNKSVDFERDWKVMTILIGANNLCDCSYNDKSTPAAFAAQLEQVIEQVYAGIPRTFVNLVTLFNISQVYTISQGHPYCEFFHKEFDECPDLAQTPERRQHMDDFAAQYNEQLYRIADQWQQRRLDNFTVVVQPFTQEMRILSVDDVSHLDCFHPSSIADMGMAVGLWNSMLLPAGRKPVAIDPTMLPICPDASSRLQ